MKFRALEPDEIEVRVGTVGAKGVTLLLYKNVRVDQSILDEVYGTEWWQRDHKELKGNLFSGVSVWNKEISQWVTKWDCGTESNTEKEKGEASDSFKRACTNLGIGRELYTSPFIFVSMETVRNDKGRYDLKDKFALNGAKVLDIKYEETANKRSIKSVTICDSKGNVVFPSGYSKPKPVATKPEVKAEHITEHQRVEIEQEIERTGTDLKKLMASYKVKDLDDMTEAQYKNVLEILGKRPDKE